MNLTGLAKSFFNKYYKGQHPEHALRYLPIVTLLKNLHLDNAKILDVGSGPLSITPYLKVPVDGIDMDFSEGGNSPLLNKIKGTGANLPFRKNSYDVVISTDTLEHIPKHDREKTIYDMIKVARNLVVIVVPTGKLSEKQDRELDQYYQKVFKKRDKFLSEHVENGLPQNEEILVSIHKILRSLNKKATVSSKPILNLFVRKILMKTWISKNKYIYYTYMKGFLLLLPILRLANFGNCYRRMFVIEFSS